MTLCDALHLFRCPSCHAALGTDGAGVVCNGESAHAIEVEDGLPVFARPDVGKYDPGYAARYAALWAFGFATRHSGLDEALYRSVSSLVAEALAEAGNAQPVIVDAACGVGRVTGDCARLAPGATVIAFDGSPAMLELAQRIVHGRDPIAVDLPTYGFPRLTIPPYGLDSPILARANVEDLPLNDGTADLVLSVNVVDRLPHGPEAMLRECQRILRPGGTLVFTDPFNWIVADWWERYPDANAVLRRIEATGFELVTWFDDLFYREILDGRGSFEEFRTLVVRARKRP